MAAIPVRAYAVAATLQPREFAELFGDGEVERVKLTKTLLVVRQGARKWAVVYDFGALVLFDFDAEEAARAANRLAAKLGETELRPPLAETYSIELAEGAASRVEFDRVILGELDARSVELVSLVIAQSVAMEYYEAEVDSLVGQLERLSRGLASRGGFRGGSRDLLRVVGRGMTTRTQVVHTLALLDAPLIAWESETLDRLYRALRTLFEIEDRYRAFDHKLRVIQDNLSLMVDLSQARRSMWLEVAVILLIVVEIVLAYVQTFGHP
jgi:required for meiotic nuclear division protein 1